jgi:hypothetical protein
MNVNLRIGQQTKEYDTSRQKNTRHMYRTLFENAT